MDRLGLKASARAYAIQGLIKYHGLRNRRLRIPYHDSISVCMKSLPTLTTVETVPRLASDIVHIDGRSASQNEKARVTVVLDRLRQIARKKSTYCRVESRNPEVEGKGLGFSASGFAALGLAGATALAASLKQRELSEVVRLGAGSASRSLVGGFGIWYANKNGRSYAEQLADEDSTPLRTLIVPIPSQVKTDRAHEDSVESPFYSSRVSYLGGMIAQMKRAISRRDVGAIGRLAEEDTLNLHAVTMTGPRGMILFSPLTVKVIDEVRLLRQNGTPAWLSLDTGPSVFVNTTTDALPSVRKSLSTLTDTVLVSRPGGPAELVNRHLF